MKLRNVSVWTPPVPRGYEPVVSIGRTAYTVTAQIKGKGPVSLHVHSVRLAFRATDAEAADAWRKAGAECPCCQYARTPAEERNKPVDEPYLSTWLALHKKHRAALGKSYGGHKKDLVEAARLADEKYKVYLKSVDARMRGWVKEGAK